MLLGQILNKVFLFRVPLFPYAFFLFIKFGIIYPRNERRTLFKTQDHIINIVNQRVIKCRELCFSSLYPLKSN